MEIQKYYDKGMKKFAQKRRINLLAPSIGECIDFITTSQNEKTPKIYR